MKKSKVGTWLFVIIVWLILVGMVSFGGFILINVNYQITLEDEIWTIENEMSDELFQKMIKSRVYYHMKIC